MLILLVVLFSSPLSAGAAPPAGAKGTVRNKAVRQQKRFVDPSERKLDGKLRDRLRTHANEETDVIVEFTDSADNLDVVRGFGKAGRKLAGMKGRTLRVPTALLKRLAESGKIKKISLDRPVEGFNGRTAVTVGARTVNQTMGYRGTGIGVAVIDSGVTPWHDDLTVSNRQGQRVVHFKDFVNGRTQPYDDWGHGTHVAGIIAGNGYDSFGTREGIASRSNVIALKALDSNGAGRISNIIAAIDYAISIKDVYNIRVINMSLGAGVYESYNTDPLTLAAKRAVDAGIVVVAAAGNMGRAQDGQPQYGAISAPANAPWVLTVGASSSEGTVSRHDDKIAPYSSRGPTMFDNAAKPDLVAPGSGTVSLSDAQSAMYLSKASMLIAAGGQNGGGYSLGLGQFKPYLTLSGTSMATPVVAGSVALMLQANPNLTPNLVKAILQYTAQVYPGYDWMTQGAGFLNARGAVQLAEYFREGRRGDRYPKMKGWSQHIFWGNFRVTGGVLTPGGTAWASNIVWGNSVTPNGNPIVWGENCDSFGDCANDNIVWGNNLVWGNADGDNIVWGNTDGDNIVWGNNAVANITWANGDSDNIVWGNTTNALDNIVWGNDCGGFDCDTQTNDNIVWGNCVDSNGDGLCDDNIVWGNAEGLQHVVWAGADNIVWGNSGDEDISWGNSGTEEVFFGADEADVDGFDLTAWDDLFETAVPEPPAPPAAEPPPASEELMQGGLL